MSPDIWAAVIAGIAAVVAAIIGAIALLRAHHKDLPDSRQGKFESNDRGSLSQTQGDPNHGQSHLSPELAITKTQAASVYLDIDDDGHFVGGDREQSTEAVLELLDRPKEERHIVVRAVPLADQDYKRKNPDAYARLRQQIRMYEKGLNLLIRGGVFYYWKWQYLDLVEAVLELRNIVLPAQHNRERWYVWPETEPAKALCVFLTQEDSESIKTGFYQDPTDSNNNSAERIQGVPDHEPIWIRSVFPQIVWGRIVPAVIARQVERNDDLKIDITNWVISDHHPSELERTRPTVSKSGFSPSPWAW